MELDGRSQGISEPVGVTASPATTHGQPLLVATRSLDEMTASPVGRCIIGTSFAVWCATPDLQGSIFWGALDEAAIREAHAVGEFIRNPVISRRRKALTDCSAVERIEPDILLAFSGRRASNEAWSTTIQRQAFVVPAGLAGMMMAGSLASAGADHPVKIARDLDEAFAVLEHPLARGAHAAASVIVAGVRGVELLLTRLRVYVQRNLDCATIESSAVALGMSPRTLQRQLAERDTSFSDELRKVRIATAESLLVHTDLKIEAIATQVGFGTASRMSLYLRRALNVTATELRADRRRQP